MKYIYIPYNEHKTSSATPYISYLVQAGDFSVTSNLDASKTTKSYNVFQNVISYTLDSIGQTEPLPPSNPNFTNVTLQVNKKDIKTFLKYSSVEKNVLIALDYIYYNFPATILIEDNILGNVGTNILNSTYNPISDTTVFVVNVNFLYNPLNINFLNFDLANREKYAAHRNLKDSFSNYYFEYDGVKYPIKNFQGAASLQNSFISLQVVGKPFENGNHSLNCYISPSNQIKETYLKEAPLFVSILNSNEKSDGYYIVFLDKVLTNNNMNLEYDLTLIFPKTDKYNIDFSTTNFDIFKTAILEYAKKQDDYDTNILLRKYVEPNLFLPIYDSFESVENQYDKLETLLSVFSYSFDEQYKFIHGLKNLNILTYDSEDNMPIELLDMFLDSHGLQINEKLSISKKKEIGLVLSWLMKSKGTRAAVKFIFEFLNIPLELVNFKEYTKKIAGTINIPLLQSYLKIIYGNSDLVDISVDENGYPKINPTSVFEDSSYWEQFYVLDPNLSGKYQTKINTKVTQDNIYNYGFEGSGSTFNYEVASSSCYLTQSGIVDDVLKQSYYDECGCFVDLEDKALQVQLDPVPLYTGCTQPLVDIWQECLGIDQIKMHINAYGGKPPYAYYGVQDGEILPSAQLFASYVRDSIGCESIVSTGQTFCYNPTCTTNPIIVNLGYTCDVDINGIPTGDATVTLLVSGGTPPYIIHGNEAGDTLPYGETIVTEVIDSLGCTSGIISELAICTLPNPCDFVELISNGECKYNARARNSKVDVTYNLNNVPNNSDVLSVVMNINSVLGGNIVNGPVTEFFQSQSGAKTLTIDFGEVLDTVVLNIDITITLVSGCTYTDSYSLSVDCTLLGNDSVDTYTNILYP